MRHSFLLQSSLYFLKRLTHFLYNAYLSYENQNQISPSERLFLKQTNDALMDDNHKDKLRIDIQSGKGAFMSHLEKYGVAKVSQPPIMIKHSKQLPSRNKTLYGLAAQVFG